MSGSLQLGTIAGIRMSAHYSWLLILALFTASLATGWFSYTLPGFPLDGGRVLRSLLWKLTGSAQSATHWSAEVGQVVAFLLILVGIWLIVTGGLFSGLWLAVIGWFLLPAARNAGTRAIRETRFQNVSIDQAMRSVLRVVSPGMTVQNLMESYMLPRKLSAVPVMEGEQVVGLITLTAVEQVPREAWEHVMVGQIMTPRHQLQTVSPQQPLQEALTLVDQRDDQHLLVMQDDHLAGIVSRDTIVRLMETLPAQGQAGDETQRTNHLRRALLPITCWPVTPLPGWRQTWQRSPPP